MKLWKTKVSTKYLNKEKCELDHSNTIYLIALLPFKRDAVEVATNWLELWHTKHFCWALSTKKRAITSYQYCGSLAPKWSHFRAKFRCITTQNVNEMRDAEGDIVAWHTVRIDKLQAIFLYFFYHNCSSLSKKTEKALANTTSACAHASKELGSSPPLFCLYWMRLERGKWARRLQSNYHVLLN